MNNPAGKVYFVSAPGRVKVGYTLQPERRLRTLRDVDMEQLTTIAVISGSRKLEKKLHSLLEQYRLRGEWFEDRPEVRAVIDGAVSGAITVPSDEYFDLPESQETDAVVLANPLVMGACRKLAEDLDVSIRRKDDKYEIRARANALIAVTEILLGCQLLKRA